MTLLLQGQPPTSQQQEAPELESPPLREVCLVGEASADSGWALGAGVRRGGRVYRVSAALAPAPDDPRRYAYLSAVPDVEPTTA